MTVHYGPYRELATAHGAVTDWCTAHVHRTASPRWEIYGPHHADPTKVWTEVYHQLA